jgi:hypothetical protein
MWTKILRKTNSSFPSQSSSRFATRWLLVGFPTKLLWKNEFSPVNIISPWLSMLLITWGMNNRPVGGRSSETWSYPIVMIVNMCKSMFSVYVRSAQDFHISPLHHCMVVCTAWTLHSRIVRWNRCFMCLRFDLWNCSSVEHCIFFNAADEQLLNEYC